MYPIQSIYRYPIKSIGGELVESCLIKRTGLEYDRTWMLVSDQDQMITQRELADLAKLNARVVGDELKVYEQNQCLFTINVHQKEEQIVNTQVWGSKVKANLVSNNASEFFSTYFAQSIRLVTHGLSFERTKLDRHNNIEFQTYFSDGYPILLANQSSLNDLNGRMKHKIKMNRFRGNIIVDLLKPFAEDQLTDFQIDGHPFKFQNRRKRCMMVNINQETAVSNPEPLKVLATYRKIDNGVCFGISTISFDTFELKTGMMLHF